MIAAIDFCTHLTFEIKFELVASNTKGKRKKYCSWFNLILKEC
jgi:hypothetical protein